VADLRCGECPCWEPCGDARYPNEGECEIMAIQTTRVRKCFPRAADIAKAVDKWRVWRAEREAEEKSGG